MKMVTFNAWREGRCVTLSELLLLLLPKIQGFTWRLSLAEISPHPMAEELEVVAGQKALGTRELVELVAPGVQIIDGKIEGFVDARASSPSIVIRAVDSTSWDVESEDDEILSTIGHEYPDAVTPTYSREFD
jgi:hypothetical protein